VLYKIPASAHHIMPTLAGVRFRNESVWLKDSFGLYFIAMMKYVAEPLDVTVAVENRTVSSTYSSSVVSVKRGSKPQEQPAFEQDMAWPQLVTILKNQTRHPDFKFLKGGKVVAVGELKSLVKFRPLLKALLVGVHPLASSFCNYCNVAYNACAGLLCFLEGPVAEAQQAWVHGVYSL
jgi:hypothetical protein